MAVHQENTAIMTDGVQSTDFSRVLS